MRLAWWVLLLLASACVRTNAVTCESGRVCAEGTRCVEDRCVPLTCGDGEQQAPEVCDGEDLGGIDCRALGFYGASGLACNEICELDDSACIGGRCGDNVTNGPELCDLTTLAMCGDFDFDVGRVTCAGSCIVDTSGCERLGWSVMPSGTTQDLFGVWTDGADFAIAVGRGGLILHWDGVAWAPRPSTTMVDLLAVSGSSRDHVIAVGREGTILQWNGTTWSAMPSGTTRDLQGVAVVTPERAFVVGRTALLELGPSGWTAMQNNAPLGDWNAAWANATTLVIAGSYATARRYENNVWTNIEGPIAMNQQSYAVWGRASNDLWIVGDAGRRLRVTPGQTQVITDINIPWHGVVGDDRFVYVVGGDGTIQKFTQPGNLVDVVESPVTEELMAVHGRTSSDVFAVGRNGRILRMVGLDSRDDSAATTTTFHAAWGMGPNVLYAAGSSRSVWKSEQGITDLVAFEAGAAEARGLWGADAARLVVVDENGNIAERVTEGGAFTVVRTPVTGESLNAVWGVSADNVFVVGSSNDTTGLVLARRGSFAWTTLPLPPGTPALFGVTGTSASDVYAAGDGGVILHFDGTAWSQVRAPVTGQRLNAIWTNGDRLIAAGTEIVMRHRDGWLSMQSDRELRAVWGSTSADVWVGGEAGTVQHFDGFSWVPLSLRSSRTIRGIAGTNRTIDTSVAASNDVMFVGDFGLARRIIRHPEAHEVCTDRWDNDYDGLAGCADPDCATHLFCTSGGRCRDALVATCGTRTGTTRGGPSRLDVYSCSGDPALRTEAYYRFVAPASGEVNVRISEADPDLTVSILGASTGACDPDKCVAHGTDVAFTATAGEEYFVVVDSPSARPGDHVLEIDCP